MKQLFSYYDEGDRRVLEGDSFITRRIDSETEARLDAINKRFDELDKESNSQFTDPKLNILSPLHYVLLACGVIIIGLLIYLTSAFGSLDKGFEAQPIFAVIIGVTCLAVVILTVVDKAKRGTKKELDPIEAEMNALAEEEDTLMNASFDALGISDDGDGIDVLTPPTEQELSALSHIETVYLTFIEDDTHISLTDLRVRYDIPKSAFVSVKHIEKPITIGFTFRMLDRGFLKENGIKTVKDNRYQLSGYDVFTVRGKEDEYLLALPSYDGQRLAEMLGIGYEA